MRKLAILVSALALVALPLMAEEHPALEVFGGYQYVHLDPINAHGWNLAATGNLNRWLGVTADFSGTYKSGSSLHTYMFGPQFSARSEHVTPFVHVLFGGARAEGTSAFAMAVGGGVDANVGKHLALRLVQGDWLYFKSGSASAARNARISAGVVFRF